MNSKKKILIVYDVAYPFVQGGGQLRLFEVAKYLVKAGFDVTWLSFKTWEGESCFTSNEGIHYVGMDGFPGLYNKKGNRNKLEPLIFCRSLLKQNQVNFKDFDVIWTGQWPTLHLVFWSLLPSFLFDSRKVIVDYWEVWGTTWFKYSKLLGWAGYLCERLIISLLGRKALFVFISPAAHKTALKMNSRIKAAFINNGIDLDKINKIKAPRRTHDLVYFGRLKNHKNVDMLIEAVAHCRDVHGQKFSLKIIGNGEEKDKLKALIKSLSLEDAVTILDDVHDNEALYAHVKASKLFVNPSNKEGGGSITVFEAMGLGVPPMFFDVKDGVDKKLITDSKTGELTGFVVDEFSVVSLADKITKTLGDDAKLKEISNASKIFAKDLGWQEIATLYQGQIGNIMSEKK